VRNAAPRCRAGDNHAVDDVRTIQRELLSDEPSERKSEEVDAPGHPV
jgi:hypothetical protein